METLPKLSLPDTDPGSCHRHRADSDRCRLWLCARGLGPDHHPGRDCDHGLSPGAGALCLASSLKKLRPPQGPSPLRRAWTSYRWPLLGLALILLAFLVLSLTVEGFFNIWNIISLIILLVILILTRTLGRQFQQNRSAFIGIMVLAGLFSVGSMNIEGFASGNNIKSMLLFASFLGIASIGQTLVALLGGLDLSIPFVIGAANMGLLYLIGLGVPPWLAT